MDPTELNALYAALLAGDDEHRALGPRSVTYVATILHPAFRDAIRWQALIRNPTDPADPPRPSARKEMQTLVRRPTAHLPRLRRQRPPSGLLVAAREHRHAAR